MLNQAQFVFEGLQAEGCTLAYQRARRGRCVVRRLLLEVVCGQGVSGALRVVAVLPFGNLRVLGLIVEELGLLVVAGAVQLVNNIHGRYSVFVFRAVSASVDGEGFLRV